MVNLGELTVVHDDIPEASYLYVHVCYCSRETDISTEMLPDVLSII